jgi:ABC-type Fe3+-hydroxamate transport system substrate-binding protein
MRRIFTDMTGREVIIDGIPKRIISVVPSQTELLYDLGLDDEVVGITKFCVHPDEWFRNKKRVGGTKTLHADIIRLLNPDLIIANKEENTREEIEALAAEFPVWISDIKTVEQGLEMIMSVGEITGRPGEAADIVSRVKDGFADLEHAGGERRKIAYYIWRGPWMCAGSDTFISDMTDRMGWVNVVTDTRYPTIEPSALKDSGVELILLSSEPYPFKEKHIQEIKDMLPGVSVALVDGEMFSWYGSRMLRATKYLKDFVQERM